MTSPSPYLRRVDAAAYVSDHYFPLAWRTLQKFATVGGGPAFRKAGKHLVVYEREALDRWAQERLSAPRRSTSEAQSRAA